MSLPAATSTARSCDAVVPQGQQVKLLPLGGVPLPHHGPRQDEDDQDLHGVTHDRSAAQMLYS